MIARLIRSLKVIGSMVLLPAGVYLKSEVPLFSFLLLVFSGQIRGIDKVTGARDRGKLFASDYPCFESAKVILGGTNAGLVADDILSVQAMSDLSGRYPEFVQLAASGPAEMRNFVELVATIRISLR